MKDQTEGRPLMQVEEFAPELLRTADGRPVVAMSLYAAKPSDGRPVYAVSLLLDDGQVAQAVSFWANGVLQTPDGRPVFAAALFDDVGAPDDLGGGVPTLLGLVSLPSQNPLPENATDLHTIGSLLNTTAGSTCTLIDDDGGRVAIVEYSPDLWLLYRSGASPLDYETEPQLNIIVRETLAGASNSPRDSAITIQVTNVLEAASLAALGGTFSLFEDAASGAVAGALTNVTPGSTLSLVDSAGGRVALDGSNIVRGVTALDYESATSHSFTVRETLADSPNSPRDTVLSLSVVDVSEGSSALSSFAAVQTSVAGASPYSFSGTLGDDIEPLFILEIRRSTSSAKDSNGDYLTTTLSVSHILSYEDWVNRFIPQDSLVASGWSQPTGTFYEQYWWSDGGSRVGPRSELTDTIAASVATWTQSDGDSRSSMVDTSSTTGHLTATMGSTPSSPANVRATIPALTAKSYWETTLNVAVNSNGTLMLGMVDLAEDFGPTGLFPFVGRDSPGFGFRFVLGSTSVSRYYDATTKTAATLSVACAAGDMFGIETDEVAGVARLYHRPVSTGTWYLVTTITMTSSMPAAGAWYASSAGFASTTSWTTNFGKTAFSRTPTTGFDFYG